MHLRRAHPEEAFGLSELCFRSKAHWGYDAAFMAACRAALAIDAAKIVRQPVVVALDSEGCLAGVHALAFEGAIADLDLLFVDPPAIGTGVGRALFTDAAARARRQGCRALTVLADPHAAAFYERMGCRFVAMRPSDAVGGRQLPLFKLDLSGTDHQPTRTLA